MKKERASEDHGVHRDKCISFIYAETESDKKAKTKSELKRKVAYVRESCVCVNFIHESLANVCICLATRSAVVRLLLELHGSEVN